MSNIGIKPKPNFTEEQGKVFLGKHLLVGITHCDPNGAAISQEQFHGIIDRINLTEGIVLKLHGSSKERSIPPELSRLQMARPGQYQLTGSNEVVEDPDYTLRLALHPDGYKSI